MDAEKWESDLLRLEATHLGDRTNVSVHGEIEYLSTQLFRDALADLSGRGHIHITLDLNGVDYFGSAGADALLSVRQMILGLNGTLTLRAPSVAVMRVLDLTGLIDVFPIDFE